MKVSLELNSSLGVENVFNKKQTFEVKSSLDENVKSYAKELQECANKANHKWATDDIEDNVYVVCSVDGEESGPDYNQLENYLDSLMD